MNDEIMKVASECGFGALTEHGEVCVTKLYRAAYNNAIKDVMWKWNGGITLSDIRALEKK